MKEIKGQPQRRSLMRLKLILKQHRPHQLIPINYQYLISSFIYRTIENSDNEYSKWLHESGFMSGNKKFKLFTFSKLNIKDCSNENLHGNVYIKVKSEKMELIVSMLAEKTVENFIIGLFENQMMKIYDKNLESQFYVSTAL